MNFEEKKSAQLIKEVVDEITKIDVTKDYRLKAVENHVFKDGFIIESNILRKLITHEYKNQRVAILGFTITKKNIEIQSIQGINNPDFKHPSNWHQLLLTPFIASCLKVYQTPERLSRHISYPDISSGLIEGRIKEMERLIKNIIENKNATGINLIDEKRISYYKEKIKALNQRLILTKKIRDDYFTKQGFVNLNKSRVSFIVDKYQKQLLKIKNKKPIVRIKRLRKNTIKKR
jgi:hypothetical protein